MNISTMLEQDADDIGMLLGHRPHQGRLVTFFLSGTDIGAMLEEQRDRLQIPHPRGTHQRRLAHVQCGVRVGAVVE